MSEQKTDYHGRVIMATDTAEAAEVVAELEAERDALLEMLIERDGGSHDQDCKVYDIHVRACTCGHEKAQRLIAKAYGEDND